MFMSNISLPYSFFIFHIPVAKGSFTVPANCIFRCSGGWDLLSRQPIPGLPELLERRLDRVEDMGFNLLSLLADIRRNKS